MLAISRSPSVNGTLSQRTSPARSAGYLREAEPVSASVRTLANQSDEYAGQKREDERLQKCDEQLENHDSERHQNRQRYQQPAAKREDETDQGKEHDVPGRHVGEETDRQRERLGELSDQLDRRENGRDEQLHAERHVVRP